MRAVPVVVLWVLLLSTVSLQAAYITDKLVAGLYKENRVSGKPLKALSSGTPLEVIEREDGFIKVRTSDGTIGWVEATYLTDEKPAKSLLLDAQARVSMLQKQLNQLKTLQEKNGSADAVAGLAAMQEKLARAEGQVSQLELQLQAARVNIKNLEAEKKLFEREKEKLLEDVRAAVQSELGQLEKDKAALQSRIAEAGNILNMASVDRGVTGSGLTQPFQASVSPAPLRQDTASQSLIKSLGGAVLWFLVGISLLAGIVLGYFYMRHKVQQRFGNAFRL